MSKINEDIALDEYKRRWEQVTAKMKYHMSLKDAELFAESLVKKLNLHDVSNNEVAVCASCGSANINKESDGIWCYDCNEWESTN